MFPHIELNSWFRKKVLIFLIVLIVPLVVLEIWATNRLSTYGEKIIKLQQIQAQLSLENEVLEGQIADRSSLSEISKQAVSWGFQKSKNVMYLH